MNDEDECELYTCLTNTIFNSKPLHTAAEQQTALYALPDNILDAKIFHNEIMTLKRKCINAALTVLCFSGHILYYQP